MKQSLKQSVVERFEAVELDADQLARLEAQTAASSVQRSARQTRFAWLGWPAATAAAVILSIGLYLGNHFYQEHSANVLLQAIAVEVASNHLKLKPLEVKSENLRDVLRYFDRLDFQLLESTSIASNAGDQLLGGRYCSIQGIDAAQLRVASADGQLSTWYEATLPTEKLARIPSLDDDDQPAVFTVKGLRVRIWREHGVVFAEARQPKTATGS